MPVLLDTFRTDDFVLTTRKKKIKIFQTTDEKLVEVLLLH